MSIGQASTSFGPWLSMARSQSTAAVRTFVDKGVERPLVPPNYLRPIDEELDELLDIGSRYPGLAKSEVIGHSIEGRPIVAVHVTNFADPRPRPLIGLTGTAHGDEIGNGPFGMAVLHHVLRDQATQAGPRSILEAREVRAIPYLNPDGRAYAERGYVTGEKSDLMHRTNARGVDLNRNFPDNWGTTPTRRGSAGSGPASEPEVQAAVAYWRTHRPDLFIDVHSAGERILLPPDATDDVVHFAKTMARRNDYGVTSSAKFTAGGTSGTGKDWVYHELGAPSFTLETGTTHHMTDADLAASVLRNSRALSWALRAADDPIARSRGPIVHTADRAADGRLVVEARSDGLDRPVAGVEATTDPLASIGSGTRLDAGDGRWLLDATNLDRLQARAGAGLVYTRAVDDRGNWGAITALGARPI